jgi:hypothetical protein
LDFAGSPHIVDRFQDFTVELMLAIDTAMK